MLRSPDCIFCMVLLKGCLNVIRFRFTHLVTHFCPDLYISDCFENDLTYSTALFGGHVIGTTGESSGEILEKSWQAYDKNQSNNS